MIRKCLPFCLDLSVLLNVNTMLNMVRDNNWGNIFRKRLRRSAELMEIYGALWYQLRA